MKTRRFAGYIAVAILLTFLAPIVLYMLQAYAETYVAGQFGATFPQSLRDGKATQDSIGGLDLSDQPLKDSLSLGGKLGHYFTRARWIGVETGVSYSTPHIKEGSLTFTGPGGSATIGGLSGVHQRMIIWDVVTLMIRYPGYRLQPYVGIGPSLFFATLKGPTAPPGQSAMGIGLNGEIGARYYITRNWALFGEGQYHLAPHLGYISNDSNPAADPFGFRATYSAFTVSLGVSYSF
jgi:hypothetical protein